MPIVLTQSEKTVGFVASVSQSRRSFDLAKLVKKPFHPNLMRLVSSYLASLTMRNTREIRGRFAMGFHATVTVKGASSRSRSKQTGAAKTISLQDATRAVRGLLTRVDYRPVLRRHLIECCM